MASSNAQSTHDALFGSASKMEASGNVDVESDSGYISHHHHSQTTLNSSQLDASCVFEGTKKAQAQAPLPPTVLRALHCNGIDFGDFIGYGQTSSPLQRPDHDSNTKKWNTLDEDSVPLQERRRTPTKRKAFGPNHNTYHSSQCDKFALDDIASPTEICKTPTKRTPPPLRRQHSAGPSSKKRLCFASDVDRYSSRSSIERQYCGGVERMDIIAMLEPYPVLDYLFELLSSRTLHTMTMVSHRWHCIVNANKRAAARVQTFRMERIMHKENFCQTPLYTNKSGMIYDGVPLPLPFHTRNSELPSELVSGSSSQPTSATDAMQSVDRKFKDHQKVVNSLKRDGRLVKCPRCGRGSKIHHHTPKNNSTPNIGPATAAKLNKIFQKSVLHKAGSVEREDVSTVIANVSDTYGKCSGVACDYEFCLSCLCKFHPGERCPLTELGTPSKILQSPEKSSSPQCSNRLKSKQKRKSLKRLCF